MNTNHLHLMQLHDSAFPIGSYTHSFGMESYIQDGSIYDQESLKQYCCSYLFDNLAYGDGLIAKETMEAVFKKSFAQISEIASLCHAIKIAKESREGSIQMGQQFLKTICSMDMEGPGNVIKQELKKQNLPFHYPIVYGMYTVMSYMDHFDALTTYLYSSTTAMIHNAVRAIPLGQTTGVRTIYQLLPAFEEAAGRIMKMSLIDAGNSAAGLELASMRHEHLDVRLFIS